MQTELLAQVNSSAGTLGIELVGSILVAAWSATNGTEALMIAVAEIHDQGESRSRVRVILTALIFTLVAIVSGAIALAAVVALPVMRASLGLSSTAGPLLSWLRWPALAGLLLLGLAGLYRYGPPRAPAKWRGVTPGSVIAACLWLCGSALFSWFVANFTSHTRLDGSIAAITMLLGWFLMTAYFVILGATIDVELMR